jgi:hypothetical protein
MRDPGVGRCHLPYFRIARTHKSSAARPVKTNKPLYDWSVFFSDVNNGAAMERISHPEAKEAFEILKSMSATAQYLAQIPQRPPCEEGLSVNPVQR